MKLDKICIFVVFLGILASDLEGARGPAAGGGRSSGGGRSGSSAPHRTQQQTMHRTPTMSRATAGQPQTVRVQPQNRPQPVRAQPQNRPQTARAQPSKQQTLQRDQMQQQVRQHAQTQVQRPQWDTNALAQRQQAFTQQRGGQVRDAQQFSLNTSQRLQQSRPGYQNWFNNDFFQKHDLKPAYGNEGVNWWKAASWATLSRWGTWDWTTPYYYDEWGYPLSVSDAAQSYGDSSITGDWLPLGVFAIGRNGNEAAISNRVLQLTVNRTGQIAGTFYQATNDTAYEIAGMIDARSQQAYWALTNLADSPVASTGIYNLTEAYTPMQVRFSDGTVQTWALVRLQM